MKIIGLTGGIGSGKTTVANMFAELGVPVYNSDVEAKKLTNSSSIIRDEITALLGEEAYKNGQLNRKFLADKIFNDEELLKKVNAIIHPQVASHFQEWVRNQHGPYVIKEAAILFESGSHQHCDAVIMVTAPEEERIKRVMARDNVSREEVLARMRNQWSDLQKIKWADYVIENTSLSETKNRVIVLNSQLS